jgi:hypothetical protein
MQGIITPHPASKYKYLTPIKSLKLVGTELLCRAATVFLPLINLFLLSILVNSFSNPRLKKTKMLKRKKT